MTKKPTAAGAKRKPAPAPPTPKAPRTPPLLTKARGQPPPPLRPSTRDAVLNAAVQVLAHNPAATVDDVVAASGVSRATVFRLFPARSDLVREAGVHAVTALCGALDGLDLARGTPLQRLTRAVEGLMAHGSHLHFLASAADLFDDAALVRALSEVDQRVAPVFDDAIAAGVIDDQVPRAWLWAAAEALFVAAGAEVSRGTMAAADAPAHVLRALLRGFGGPAA